MWLQFCEQFYSPLKLSLTSKQEFTAFHTGRALPSFATPYLPSFLDIGEVMSVPTRVSMHSCRVTQTINI